MNAPDRRADFPEILASIVHDMKNSLGMILTAADETVSDCGPRNCPSSRHLSQMQYETKRLNNNLVQLLTLYKMDRAQYVPNITDNPVCEFIEETIIQNKPLLDYRGIEVVTNCSEELYWFFDRNLIAGVINNILNNAYRYANNMLKVSAREEGGYLVISVEDNGDGYPEAMMAIAGQETGETSFATGSTGLGIYFASVVAGLHKNRGKSGKIELKNGCSLGGGCFSVYLP